MTVQHIGAVSGLQWIGNMQKDKKQIFLIALLMVGRLQTGSYQKNDGTRSYFTELIVADCQIIDFADRESTDSKKEKENQV